VRLPETAWGSARTRITSTIRKKAGRIRASASTRELGRHVASKAEAQAETEKIRVAIREGRFRRRADPPAACASAPQEIAWEQFARTHLERRGKPATVNESGYLNRLASFVLPGARGARFGGKPLAAITTDDGEAMFAMLRQEGKAASTLNKYRQFLRRLFRWA